MTKSVLPPDYDVYIQLQSGSQHAAHTALTMSSDASASLQIKTVFTIRQHESETCCPSLTASPYPCQLVKPACSNICYPFVINCLHFMIICNNRVNVLRVFDAYCDDFDSLKHTPMECLLLLRSYCTR